MAKREASELLSSSRQTAEIHENLYRELGRKGSKVRRDPELATAIEKDLRNVLAKLRLSWVKYHHEDALMDAVELCAMSGLAKPQWMREALIERGFEAVRGIKWKKKPGARSDFLRDHFLFTAVQGRRDADPDHHLGTAVLGAHAELKRLGLVIKVDRIEKIYQKHRKLVTRRNGEWVRRTNVYFPRRSGAFWSLPSEF